uniref:Tumor necrosis factor receptor superfamily, member 21 n=1 Tax=Neogobius melanostomus TaxID=47308 RepID=A0A8C6WE73_9GOBI
CPSRCSSVWSQCLTVPKASLNHPSVPSTHKYQHIDPSSGSHMTCDKCPAGTFVSSHCSPSSYTRGENGIEQCHRCREPCPAELVEKTPCSAILDRVCSCPAGTFLSEGVRCKPHSQCPPGTRVKRRGSETEDVLCKPCGKGTFSEGNTSAVRCRTHQDCQAQGLVLITPGARERDNVCGPPSSHPIIGTSSITPSHTSTTEPPTSASTALGSDQMEEYSTRSSAPSSHKSHAGHGNIDTVKLGTGVNKVNGISSSYRPTRRGSPRPSTTEHFDINEHLPWMIVLLLLLVLVVIVVCSVKRSSRVLKKGPVQDPTSIMEKAIHKKPHGPPTQKWEKWIYYSNGQGVDILKLVAAHVGSQWIDLYQSLANATEREVAAFSNGYCSDPERAYAALQHWTIRDSDANLAKLINALHRHRRIDVVEKVRCTMEDNPQFDLNQLMPSVNGSQSLSPVHRPLGNAVGMEPSPSPKGFFPDESEPLLRCDSTSSKDSALSRNGSFITKEKKDTVLRQVRLDPCDLQPVFDEMLHILNPEELHALEQIPSAEDKLDRLFEIAGVKSQEASQTLLDSVYSHLPDLL